MNAGQYEGIMRALGQIVERMPERSDPEPAPEPEPVRNDTPVTDRKLAIWGTLHSMLGVLDGWIEGAKENHEALDHRGESTEDPCWERFHPDDIRSMINDVANELGVAEPWKRDKRR